MDGHQKRSWLILVKPTGHGTQSAPTFLKATNSKPCKHKFQLPKNTKRDIGYKILEGLNEQRNRENALCDVVLVIEGKHIYAHRAVLAVQSEYFRAMFTLDMMESRKNEVEMHDTTHAALSAAVEFIYTGAFEVWQEDLKDVLATACMLQLDSLIEPGVAELTNYLDVSNCIEMYNLVHLREKSEDLIKRCFYSVSGEEDFAELEATLLAKILDWDGLNLGAEGCEDDVVKAVLTWFKQNPEERTQDIDTVIRRVKLTHVTPDMQSQLKSDAILSKNKDVLTLLNSINPSQESRQFSHHIYTIGGYRLSRTGRQFPQAKSIESFNTHTKQWHYCGPLPKTLDSETALAINGKLILGKYTGSDEEQWELCSYNPVTNIWKVERELQPLIKWLTPNKSGICLKNLVKAYDQRNKMLYFCGSLLQRVGAPTRCVFQYDMGNNTIKELPSLPESRFHHGAIVLDNKLYIIGGNDWQNNVRNTNFMYDAVKESWNTMQPMEIPRVGVGLAIVDGHIYAVGGTNTVARQRSGERYDPDTNEWAPIPDMHMPRAFHGMVAAGRKIYVFGGKSYSTEAGARLVLQDTECYDKDLNEWTTMGDMNEPHWRLDSWVL